MHRLMLITIVLALAAPALAGSDTSTLKIRPHVEVSGETATLADVLIFAHADPKLVTAIGPESVAENLHSPAITTITHEQIERRLDELGVNMARVLLRGATACEVSIAPDPAASAGDTASPLLRPVSARRSGSERSLADVLRDHVNEELADIGGTAEVDFERASEPFLDLTTPRWEFSIRASGREKLGLREFRVTIRRDGKTHRTANVFARVRLSKPVLVAHRPLNVGTFVKREDVELEPRLFDREADIGIDRVERVVGQRIREFVPAGQMVRPGDLKTEDMVQRSRPVTVLGSGQGVQVRLTGIALDAGSYGDRVRVRIGDTRQNRRVLRGVVAGLGTVQIEEEQQ